MATASDITSGVTGVMRNLGSAVRGMGLAMTIGAGIAGAALVSLTQKAERVSSAFREVDTLVQGSSDAQEKYGELISDLNTKFGLQAGKLEVIEGLYQSISAGVGQSTEAQREFLETAAELAVVGRVELGTSVDILSTVMNTYGYEARQAQEISESLFQTVIFGKTRVEELAPVLGRVAALGSNLGVQIDEIGASMGVLTRTGFGARVAATGLRNIFRAMLKPSGRMQEALFNIASEQDFFAEQIEGSTQKVKDLAAQYRSANDAVQKFAEEQAAARAAQESASTAIQEARLKISAINEDRMNQLPELTSEQVKQAESVEELESIIDSYQFKVNKARLQEKKARKEREEAQANLEDYRSTIADTIASSGDLEGGIGQLVLENQNFIDTLVGLKERVNETDASMSDMFPRTRALQGALALVGDDGQMLIDIFEQMEEGTLDAAKEWDNMDESVRENFGSFEEFKEATQEVTAGDLQEWFEKATGPQQKMRNSMSRLSEAMSDLGQTFTKDVVNSIANFSDTITDLVDKFESIDKSVRENISQFAILATTIGLILGPVLFFTGQLAVMASVMGTALLPVLGVLAAGFGVLVSSFYSAIAGGEESASMFEKMRNMLSGVIDFVVLLKNYFVGILVPALTYLGNVFQDTFGEIMSQFGDNEEIGSFRSIIFEVFWAIREGIVIFAEFIDKNKELIAELTVLAVDVILNQAIPALTELAKGLIAVLQDVNWSRLASIAVPMIALLVSGIIKLTRAVGIFLQNNSQLIGSLITWAAMLIPVIVAGAKLISILASIITTVGAFIASFKALVAAVYMALQFMGPLQLILSTLAATFPNLAIVVSALTTALGYLVVAGKALVGIVSAIIGGISLTAAAIVGLIAIILGLIAAAWIMRDEMIAAVKNAVNTWIDVFKILWQFLTTDMGWREAGKRIVDRLAQGIRDGISIAKKAMNTLVDTLTGFWPSSPAEEGPLAKEPPSELGKNFAEYTAEGMVKGKTDVEGASGLLADSAKFDTDAAEFSAGKDGKGFNFGSDKAGKNMRKGDDAGKEVTVEKGAIKVGPFHGISDEELPEEVREQVQRSLQDLMDEIKGSGKDSTASLASGDGI